MSNSYETFGEVRARLDEIVTEVRKKDLSLERSLDLYEEAIQLANRCAELIDKSDYTEQEAQEAAEMISKVTDAANEIAAQDEPDSEPEPETDTPS